MNDNKESKNENINDSIDYLNQLSIAPFNTFKPSFELLIEMNSLSPKQITKKPFIRVKFSHFMIEQLVRLLCLSPTKTCYNTNRGLDANGRLRDKRKIWIMKDSHKKILEAIWKKHKKPEDGEFDEFIKLDQSLRMKVARGFTWCLVMSLVAMDCLCYSLVASDEDSNNNNNNNNDNIPIYFKNNSTTIKH
jgi:hypothetical protein